MGSRSRSKLERERDWWNYLHGQGRRHALRRKAFTKKFDQLFKKMGMMRALMRWAAAHKAQGNIFHLLSRWTALEEMHPDSFRFLQRWGTEYKSHKWHKPPAWGEPKPKGCYRNARVLMRSSAKSHKKRPNSSHSKVKIAYVEGVACGPLVDPMQHAWNAIGVEGKKAFDWTFYAANHITRYIGIPLSKEEYESICQLISPKVVGINLFNKKIFGRIQVRVRLMQIILDRKKAGKRLPLKRALR